MNTWFYAGLGAALTLIAFGALAIFVRALCFWADLNDDIDWENQ